MTEEMTRERITDLWISVDDALPKETETLCAYIVNVGDWVGMAHFVNGVFWANWLGKIHFDYPVKAWMPLPRSYEGRRFDLTREDKFKIGMALHNIVMSVGNNTLHKIEPYLKEIEDVTNRQIDTVNVPIVSEENLKGER